MKKARREIAPPGRLLRCPCCFYLTLAQRGAYQGCEVCWWEDDGQDDETADEVWGGPNSDLSLTQGRYNFARTGGCEWNALRRKTSVQLPERATGFPFADVGLLTTLPPISSWPHPFTLSFHPKTRDTAIRWLDGVRFLRAKGYRFQGTVEVKHARGPEWVHPQSMRFLEYDPALSLDKARTDSGQILVGAWFSGESSTGAHIRFPSVFRTQPNWNEPAIAIDMYAPKERAYGLFREILGDWPLMIANYSSTSWALRTIAEMTADFPAFMLVHGTTYLASSVATPTLISGFEQRFGKESVEYLPSGFVLKGEGLRGLSDSAREAYVFLREQMQQIASRIIAGS